MNCDGAKVRELRLKRGMTQDILASAAEVDRRTIQRAEEGRALQLETVAAIASVLQVTVSDLSKDELEEVDPEDNSAVVLRKTKSGKIMVDAVLDSFSGKIEADVEPNAENIDQLLSFISIIEDMMPDPWDETKLGERRLPLSERLKKSVLLSTQLEELDSKGIGVFVGTYTASAQIPRYDIDEGHLYVRTKQPYEPVTVCRVRVASNTAEKTTVRVLDVWNPPRVADRYDDEPF